MCVRVFFFAIKMLEKQTGFLLAIVDIVGLTTSDSFILLNDFDIHI